MVERRYNMDNQERITRMLIHLKQSKDYRAFIYTVYPWIGLVLFLSMCYFRRTHNVIAIFIGIISIIMICVIGVIIYKRKTSKVKILIECNINIEELLICPPGTRSPKMGTYRLVGYYTENLKTYRFCGKVKDDQHNLYNVMIRIREEGIFPKIKVLINLHNYKDYKMLGYEFIEDTVNLNKELVEDELDKYYGTSER